MRRCFPAFLLSICLVCAPVAAAQQVPDLSGNWKDVQRSSSWTSERIYTIEHLDPKLTIRTTWKTSGNAAGYGFAGGASKVCTYVTDGSERMGTGNDGCGNWVSLRWEGPTLLILRVVKNERSVIFTREMWTLSGDGRTITKSDYRLSPHGLWERTSVLEKQ